VILFKTLKVYVVSMYH